MRRINLRRKENKQAEEKAKKQEELSKKSENPQEKETKGKFIKIIIRK